MLFFVFNDIKLFAVFYDTINNLRMIGCNCKRLGRDNVLYKAAGDSFVNRSLRCEREIQTCSIISSSYVISLTKSTATKSYANRRRNAVSEKSIEERYGLTMVLKYHIINKKLKQFEVI